MPNNEDEELQKAITESLGHAQENNLPMSQEELDLQRVIEESRKNN